MRKIVLIMLTAFIAACDSSSKTETKTQESTTGQSYMSNLLRGSLVDNNNRSVNSGNTPYYLIYFSAHWCPPCRRFTPVLADFCNKNRGNSNFQVIFVSADRSNDEMLDYMKTMPWPAVKFRGDVATKLQKYAGNSIPDLEVVDSNGKVIFSSQKSGANRVLQQFSTLLDTLPKSKPKAFKFSSKSAAEIQAYKLSGVAGKGNNKQAIINGEIYSLGDEVTFGVTVEKINDKSIVLLHNGNQITISM